MTSINQSINIRLLYGMTKCQHCHSIPRSRVPYGVLRPTSRPRPTHNCKRNGDTSDFSRHTANAVGTGEVRWDAATAVTAGSTVQQPAGCRQSRRTFEQEDTWQWQCEGQFLRLVPNVFQILNNTHHRILLKCRIRASEVTTLWRCKNLFI